MTVDSNIIIAYLAGEDAVVSLIVDLRKDNRPLFLSTIVESEVLSFALWTESEKEIATKFLEENFISIAFDRPMARYTAKLRAKVKLKFPDAAIASTALMSGTPLLTRDVKGFSRVPDLKIITV